MQVLWVRVHEHEHNKTAVTQVVWVSCDIHCLTGDCGLSKDLAKTLPTSFGILSCQAIGEAQNYGALSTKARSDYHS